MAIFLILGLVSINIVCFTQGEQVCYPRFGCFSNDPPFNQALTQLPWHPDDVSTKIYLYTRETRNVSERLSLNNLKTASASSFKPNATTVFITHGFRGGKGQSYVPLLIDELLKLDDMNIIFVDWSRGAGFPYHQAFGNARLVGAQISYLIDVMVEDTGINWKQLRLIGFAMGAHIMGYASQGLRKKGYSVPRITGLDPAAPYYENAVAEVRLDPTDADFVDVIHTDSQTLLVNGIGSKTRMGHIDFFPNGGFNQLGCAKLDLNVVNYVTCSHFRAVNYFIESINSVCPFYGFPCENWEKFDKEECTKCPDEGCPKMSYHIEKPKKFIDMAFYLDTFDKAPFCGYHYEFTFYTNDAFLADLDSSVIVELFGEIGSEVITLPHKYYESGRTVTTVALGTKDIGNLKSMKVKFQKFLDTWYLRAVAVKPMYTQIEYTACYGIWLNSYKNERDFKLDYHPLQCPIEQPK